MGDTKSGWLNLAAAALWPAVGLLALLLFYDPIDALLERASGGDAKKCPLGPSRSGFRRKNLEELRPPSHDVAEKISALSDYDREILISVGAYTPHSDSCTVSGFESALKSGNKKSNDFFATRVQHVIEYRNYIGAHTSLAKLGLIKLDPRPDEDVRFCASGEGRIARITDLGSRTRRYYLDLVSKALSLTPEKP